MNNSKWSSLSPHEYDDWVIMVKGKTKVKLDIGWDVIFSIPIMLLICAVFRKFFRMITNSPHQGTAHVILDTLGIFLATNTSFRIRNRPERIMNITSLLITILISTLLTAVMFKYMLAREIDGGIETLTELGELNIPILISEDMNATMAEWSPNVP